MDFLLSPIPTISIALALVIENVKYVLTYIYQTTRLCDNGKTYISIMPIMHYKIISINDSYRDKIMIPRVLCIYFGFL